MISVEHRGGNWFRRIDWESDDVYSPDTATLLFGSALLFVALVLIKVVFQPRGTFFIGAIYVLLLLSLAVFSLGSVVFLFWRVRKFGLLLSSLPLAINLLTLATLNLFGEQRLYLSDRDVIVYHRQYSDDGRFVTFAYTLDDGPEGTPVYECVMPVADTTKNLTHYRMPLDLTARGWNPDNSLNVVSLEPEGSDRRHLRSGDTLVVHGTTLRVAGE